MVTASEIGFLMVATTVWGAIFGASLLWTRLWLQQKKPELPKTAMKKEMEIASYMASSMNAIFSCASVPFVLISLIKESPSVGWLYDELFRTRGVQGPKFADTDVFYYAFLGYILYDTLFMVIHPLTEYGSIDWISVMHHCIYFSVTLYFFVTSKFPLLALVLVAQEVSTPFLNAMLVMKILQTDEGPIFHTNAITMTVLFGIFRVLVPGAVLTCLVWDVSMGVTTYGFSEGLVLVVVFAGFLLQVFWFAKIIKGFQKHMNERGAGEDEKLAFARAQETEDRL